MKQFSLQNACGGRNISLNGSLNSLSLRRSLNELNQNNIIVQQQRQSRCACQQSETEVQVIDEEAQGLTVTDEDNIGVPQLTQITQDEFDGILKAAGDQLVVLDFYTDWCGPCKKVLPELELLNQQYDKLDIYKINANKTNKDLGKQLNIRAVPTYVFFKNSQEVARQCGADMKKFKGLIEDHISE